MRKQLKSTARTQKMRQPMALVEDGVRKKEWRGRLKICLVYPHSYFVGMSNLGFQTVYGLWNDSDEVVCERAFLSEDNTEPVSMESRRPLTDFDVIAFSISFENDYLHVLRILEQAGLHLKSEQRAEDAPLILAGGAAVSMNPLPIAPFIDAFALGDGEDLVVELATTLRASGALRSDRGKVLEKLAALSGVYVPFIHGDIPEHGLQRRSFETLDAIPTKTQIVSNYTEFSDVFLVEVSRGCSQRCRFCSVSYTEGNARFRSFDALKPSFEEGIRRVRRVGLLGAALSDHPHLLDFSEFIVNAGGEVSLSSLRVETVRPKLVELLVHSRQRTLTLALETGSARLQKIIKKRTHVETVLDVVETALRAGVRNLKFYFIIGLPTETREDVLELASLVKAAHAQFTKVSRELGRIGTLTVSLNPFIPKPTTPFQSCPHVRAEELQTRFDLVTRDVAGLHNFNLSHEGWDTAVLQSLLSVGDVRCAEFLLEATRLNDWRKALKNYEGLVEDIVYRPRTLSESLPWSFIQRSNS